MNPFSITQFNEYVSKKLNSDLNLKNLPLIGEVSGISMSGGHMYFSLKDENSVLRAVIWRNNISRIDTTLIQNGSKIVVLGDISAYARGGNYSFSIRMVESFGEGDLAKEYNRVKKLLESEGLFAREHKKPIPRLARRIGVVTSDTGAAIEDIKKIITTKNNYADIIIFPTLVQGIGSPSSIIKSIESANLVNESGKHIDVLIVGRGGGSAEDLAAFNDEGVARAIFASEIPIISAVERNNIKIQRDHLNRVMSSKIREMRLNVDKAVITLRENNPTNILSKGYALVIKDNYIVSEVSNIDLDETYRVIMADGSFEAKTTSKTQNKEV